MTMHGDEQKTTDRPAGEVLLYQTDDGAPAVEVRLDGDTVWLTQQQLAELFQTSRTNVVEHIGNIYSDSELDEARTCREFRQVRMEGNRRVARSVPHYNLDLIISLGYRVKSKVATRFRIWATERLRDYLVQGYALNDHRLEQLGRAISILARSTDELIAGTADVLASYLPSLTLLREYDEGSITTSPAATPRWVLSIVEARAVISGLAAEFPSDTLLGIERGDALEGIIDTIYQGFAGQQLYPTVEEKAANLLYLVVKDHPLSDGNKRTAAALFVTFLMRNHILTGDDGRPRVSNGAIAAITLMVAMSDPKEKALMIALLMRMISI